MQSLNPCQFCGGPPVVDHTEGSALYTVRCPQCGLAGGPEYTPEFAISQWNIAKKEVMALRLIAGYDSGNWCCGPSGCDCPTIAKMAISKATK